MTPRTKARPKAKRPSFRNAWQQDRVEGGFPDRKALDWYGFGFRRGFSAALRRMGK